MKLYHFGKTICSIYFKLFNKVEKKGLENIPKDGAVLICPNHISNLDPPLVGCLIKRPVRYMAKENLFKNKFIAWIMKEIGAFPVSREKEDRKALKTAISILKNGEVLGIFPEGTRSKNGEIGEAKSGASYFALKTDAVVIPVYIEGTYKLFSKVEITYGKPIDLTEFKEGKITAEVTEKATNKIMDAIKQLKK